MTSNWLFSALYQGLAMLWETLWALILGVGISAIIQVFMSRKQMASALGRPGLREVALATVLGAASSSCSYAAAAAGKTALQKGAALVPVLAFMFASTNLVIELAAILWSLMGWPFVLAEIVGALVLIAVMWLLVRLTLPNGLVNEMRQQAGSEKESCCSNAPDSTPRGGTWAQVGDAFVQDASMIWKEVVLGFLISGFAMVLVPASWWRALFLTNGPAPLRLIENAVVGPLVAIPSFLCSCANIALANLLWVNGISFGGVIAFIYADLIVIPLLLIYRKYYGFKGAVYIACVLFCSMVISGLAVDLLFGALGWIPAGPRLPSSMEAEAFRWNYTTWLDLASLCGVAWLFFQRRRHRKPEAAKECASESCH